MVKMMKEEYISIAEFARRAGVSRQAVQQRLDKNLREFVKEEQGRKQLNTKGLELFKGARLAQGVVKDCQGKNDVNMAIVELLKNELAAKDKQIEQQAKTIADLSAALVAAQKLAEGAQALHAGTIQQQLTSGEEAAPATAEPERKWWRFWK